MVVTNTNKSAPHLANSVLTSVAVVIVQLPAPLVVEVDRDAVLLVLPPVRLPARPREHQVVGYPDVVEEFQVIPPPSHPHPDPRVFLRAQRRLDITVRRSHVDL